MSTMRCLAIGISDAPPLEFLQGAENGAKGFGTWAKSLGIPTEILTDEQQPVGFDTVKAAFDRLFAGRPNISRLLLYFAGHGLARDAAEDLGCCRSGPPPKGPSRSGACAVGSRGTVSRN